MTPADDSRGGGLFVIWPPGRCELGGARKGVEWSDETPGALGRAALQRSAKQPWLQGREESLRSLAHW